MADSIIFLVSILITHSLINAAPSSSAAGHHPHILYDQKQTGDLNILVHLKDFQFISVLGGDDLFNGDYDYNYDENDFTEKPTRKTTTTAASTTTSSVATNDIKSKPTTQSSSSSSASSSNSSLPLTSNNQTIENKHKPSEGLSPVLASTAATPAAPNKIKVHILDAPSSAGASDFPLSPIDIGIVANDDDDDGNGSILSSEELSRKKCANGFSRDKKGRCRRLRNKPYGGGGSVASSQLFNKLTSNLAAKLRLKGPGANTAKLSN